MRATNTLLFFHIHTGTWDRLPLLVGDVREMVYRGIQDECWSMGLQAQAIGGMPDHVHLLVKMPPTLSISDFVKQWKGSSSHLAQQRLGHRNFFKWQGAYATKTISPERVPDVYRYIQNQEEHHRLRTLDSTLEWED